MHAKQSVFTVSPGALPTWFPGSIFPQTLGALCDDPNNAIGAILKMYMLQAIFRRSIPEMCSRLKICIQYSLPIPSLPPPLPLRP